MKVFTLVCMLALSGAEVAKGNVIAGSGAKLVGAVSKAGAKVAKAGVVLVAACSLLIGCDRGDRLTTGVIDNVVTSDVSSEGSGNPITLGFVYEGDEKCPESLAAAQLAVEMINNAGGVTGRQLVLLPRDNQDTDSVMRAVMDDLVIGNRVNAIIGPNTSMLSALGSQLLNNYGTPIVTAGATGTYVTTAGEAVYMTASTDFDQGYVMAKFAIQQLRARTAAVVYHDADSYSADMALAFIRGFASMGGDLPARVAYPTYEDRRDEEARRAFADAVYEGYEMVLRNSPDVVFIPGDMPSAPEAAALLRRLGVTSIFLGGDRWGADGFTEMGSTAIEGSYYSAHFAAQGEGLSNSTVRFVNRYHDKYGEMPNDIAALTYDAVFVVALAMQRVGRGWLPPQEIAFQIGLTTNYYGATSISRYNGGRQPVKDMYIMEILQGGSIEFVRVMNPK